MTTSDQINEIAAALAKAQGAMKPAVKDASNPAFKRGNKESKYADLAANVEAAREPLAQNGIAVVQEPTTVQGAIAVATRLLHSSGQWIHFDPLTVPLAKSDAHGVGSAVTYARRYSLGAALGLVAEDDDGNAAVSALPARATTKTQTITDDQRTELNDIATQHGWKADDVRKLLKERFKVESSRELQQVQYEAVKSALRDKTQPVGA